MKKGFTGLRLGLGAGVWLVSGHNTKHAATSPAKRDGQMLVVRLSRLISSQRWVHCTGKVISRLCALTVKPKSTFWVRCHRASVLMPDYCHCNDEHDTTFLLYLLLPVSRDFSSFCVAFFSSFLILVFVRPFLLLFRSSTSGVNNKHVHHYFRCATQPPQRDKACKTPVLACAPLVYQVSAVGRCSSTQPLVSSQPHHMVHFPHFPTSGRAVPGGRGCSSAGRYGGATSRPSLRSRCYI